MSVLFYPESIRILGSDANGKNVMLCEMAVDDIANLPAANAFISDGYVLSMGCVATAINDNSKHRLNGSGNWIQIAAGTSTYTRAETDAFLSAIDAEIAEDRAALAEVVNTGAKNKIYNKIHNVSESVTIHGFTFTQQDDGGIKIEYASTDSDYSDYYMAGSFNGTAIQFDLSDDDYVMSLTTKTAVSSEISNKILIRLYDRTVSPELKTNVYLNAPPVIFSSHATSVFITISKPIRNFPVEGIVVYPMICTAADWAVSKKFVPYCPTLYELYQMVLALQSGTRSLSMQPETLTKGEEPETEIREKGR